ncbi:unnamed protein product, partial [Durusdinium trenchii]
LKLSAPLRSMRSPIQVSVRASAGWQRSPSRPVLLAEVRDRSLRCGAVLDAASLGGGNGPSWSQLWRAVRRSEVSWDLWDRKINILGTELLNYWSRSKTWTSNGSIQPRASVCAAGSTATPGWPSAKCGGGGHLRGCAVQVVSFPPSEEALQLLVKNEFLKETAGLNAGINACRAGFQWELALHLAAEASATWDAVTYSMLLAACSRGSRADRSFSSDALPRRFARLSHVSSAAASACGRASAWAAALALAARDRDEAVLAAAIDACRRAQQWEAALALFGTLKSSGHRSAAGAGAAVSALAHGSRWEEALHLFESEFQLQEAMNPGIRGFAAALQACAAGGHWQIALSFLEEIERRQLPPDKRCFDIALSAYRKMPTLVEGGWTSPQWREGAVLTLSRRRCDCAPV